MSAQGNFLQYLTLQIVLTVGRCWFRSRKWGTGLLRGVPLTVNPARSSDSLSPEKTKMRSSPQQQRRGLDRQATLHTIYEEKDSKYGGYSGEHLRNSYEKRLKKISNSIRFICFWERGDGELLHVQRRMHPEAPESSKRQNDYASNQRQQYQGNTLI